MDSGRFLCCASKCSLSTQWCKTQNDIFVFCVGGKQEEFGLLTLNALLVLPCLQALRVYIQPHSRKKTQQNKQKIWRFEKKARYCGKAIWPWSHLLCFAGKEGWTQHSQITVHPKYYFLWQNLFVHVTYCSVPVESGTQDDLKIRKHH